MPEHEPISPHVLAMDLVVTDPTMKVYAVSHDRSAKNPYLEVCLVIQVRTIWRSAQYLQPSCGNPLGLWQLTPSTPEYQ